jgi:hypothetical protein
VPPLEVALVVWPLAALALITAFNPAGSCPPKSAGIVVPTCDTMTCTAGCCRSFGSLNQLFTVNEPLAGMAAVAFGPQKAPAPVTT